MKRGCIQRQPGRERQIAGEGTAMLGGGAQLGSGVLHRSPGAGMEEAGSRAGCRGVSETSPASFPSQKSPESIPMLHHPR